MFNICPLNTLLNIKFNVQIDMNLIFKTETKI